MIQDTFKIKGKAIITHTDCSGNVINRIEKDNLIVNGLKDFFANACKTATTSVFNYMAVGTGSATPGVLDTALGAEIARVLITITTITPSTNLMGAMVTFTASFGPGVGTSSTVQEAGIFNSASSGTMASRVNFFPINKGPNDTVTVQWIYTIG